MSRTTWFFMLFIMAMLAVGYYAMSQRISGGEADVHFQNGFNLAQEGKHDEAISELHRALKKDPNHELARGKLAEEYEAKGNYGDALKEWLRLLRETNEAKSSGLKRPPVTKLWYVHQHIGICKLKMGEYKEAMTSFELALKASPAKADLQLLIGETYEKMGHVKDAARAFLDAIERAPQSTEAYRRLMKLYKDRNLDKQAKELGERMKSAGSDAAKEWEKVKKQYGW